MSSLEFNCNDAPEPESFEPIPAGTEAVAEISESDYTEPNTKGTRMLKLKFTILDGAFKGRHINEGYCLVCPSSDKAQEIAQRDIRQICESLGMTGFTMTEELHGKPLLIKIGQDAPNEKGDIWNNIKSVKPYGKTESVKETPAETVAPTKPKADKPEKKETGVKPPWA